MRDAYALLQLRADAFVLEQASFYRDIDGRDFEARHLRALAGGRLAAALRLFPPSDGAAARIGRLVVAPSFRGRGFATRLMDEALAEHVRASGRAAIDLSAQTHLQGFYAGFGFRPTSDAYDEDGILHVDMRRDATR